jgi:c-di-GMP-binding flagellar brake protein YcgR
MGFHTQQDIEKQLRTISEQSIPVNVIINETVILKDCRLLFANDDKKELYVQTGYGDYPETGDVELAYVLSQAPYIFRSRILSRKTDDSRGTCYLRIQFPDKIDKTEKRKYFRVRPSKTNPIQLRLAIPDSHIINANAMDIGGGGVSFALTKDANYFNVGDSLYLDINLPAYDWLSALVVVKHITATQHMVRIGVEFSRISENAYKMIMEYVAGKMSEKDPGDRDL